MKKNTITAIIIFIALALIATFFLKGIMDSVTVSEAPKTMQAKGDSKAFALATGINRAV